jgi:membrane fusion protein, multidrug efflux system
MKHIILFAMFFTLISCKPPVDENANNPEVEVEVKKRVVAVEALVAKLDTVPEEVRGSVVAKGINELTVVAKSGGTITSVPVSLGDRVSRRKTILTVESQVQKASLAQAKLGVAQAELSFNAMEKLYNKKSVSEAEYINAKSTLSAMNAALEVSQFNYNNCWLRAPFSGVITYLDPVAKKGNLIGAGTPIAHVVDLSKLELHLFLGETEVTKVSKGNRASVFVSAVNEELEGVVIAVSEGADNSTGAFEVKVVVNNPGSIVKSGMSGTVIIASDEKNRGVIIPRSAVVNRAGESLVMKVENGLGISVPVETRSLRGNRVLVTGDISENDTVIVTGLTQLTTGDSVVVSVIER